MSNFWKWLMPSDLRFAPVKPIMLEEICKHKNWEAVIDGDNMVAALFHQTTGDYLGVIPLC